MKIDEATLILKKNASRAALFSFAGVLLVIAALLSGVFYLTYLNRELKNEIQEYEKANESRENCADIVKKIEEKAPNLVIESVVEVADENKFKSAVNSEPHANKVHATNSASNNEGFNKSIPLNPIKPPTIVKNNRLQIAIEKEREGFQSLINGNYDEAINAFEEAEKVYPTYHNAFELARILRTNKRQMNNSEKKKEIFQAIVKNYSYGAPSDLWKQVEAIANQ